MNQDNILKKINIYLKNQGREEYDSEGFCNGLVYLYFYKGNQWLTNLLTKIDSCPDDNLEDVEIELEKLINTAFWLQTPEKYLKNIRQNSAHEAINAISNPQEPQFEREAIFSFVFKKEELVHTIKQLFEENRYYQLSSSDHAMGLEYRQGKYYLYDPNEDKVEQQFNTPEEVVNALVYGYISSFNKQYPTENIPLSINILKTHKQPPSQNISKRVATTFNEILQNRTKTKQDLQINSKAWDGTTALHMAAMSGQFELVKVLVNDFKAQVNVVNTKGITPLIQAAQNGYPEIVDLLIKNGADPTKAETNGRTPLGAAAFRGNFEVVKLLLQNDSVRQHINDRDNELGTALHYAVERRENFQIVKCLLEAGADPLLVDDIKRSVLQTAVMLGQMDTAKLLLKSVNFDKSYINHQDIHQNTVLNDAVKAGYPEMVILLLQSGAGINHKNDMGNTPLHSLLSSKKTSNQLVIANILINAGIDVNAQDDEQWPALHLVINNGEPDIIKFLLSKNADPSLQNNQQNNALHLALSLDAPNDIIQEILMAKPIKDKDFINTPNMSGNTPLNIAVINENVVAVEALLKAGAKINIQDIDGDTPLYIALKQENYVLVHILLQNGADPKIVNKQGDSSQQLIESLGKNSFEIELILSQKLQEVGRYDLAQFHMNKLLKMDSQNLQALFLKAEILFGLEKYDEALVAYGEVRKLAKSGVDNDLIWRSLRGIGGCYINQDKPNETIAALKDAIKLGTHANIYNNLGYAYQLLGQHQNAIKQFDIALMQDSAHTDALQNRASSYEELGNFAAAGKDYENLSKLIPQDPIVFYDLGRCHATLGQHDKAIESFNRSLLRNNSDVNVLQERGISYYMTKQFIEAYEDFDRAAKLAPQNFEFIFMRGTALIALDKNQKAIDDFNQFFSKTDKSHPKYLKAIQNYAEACDNLDKNDEAFRAYDALIKLAKSDTDKELAWHGYRGRGYHYLEQGKYNEALQDLETALKIGPHANIFNNIGSACQKLGRHQEAIQHFTQALKLDPSHNEALLNRAFSHDAVKNYQSAITDYENYIKQVSDDPDVYHNLGMCYADIGRYDHAINVFTQALQLMKDSPVDTLKERSNSYLRAGKFGESYNDADLALRAKPNDPDSLFLRGTSLGALGKYKEAIADFKQFFTQTDASHSKYITALGNYALAHENIGDTKTVAETLYTRAKVYALNNDKPSARNDLARAKEICYAMLKQDNQNIELIQFAQKIVIAQQQIDPPQQIQTITTQVYENHEQRNSKTYR